MRLEAFFRVVRAVQVGSLLPHPQTVVIYITACASGTVERTTKANSCLVH